MMCLLVVVVLDLWFVGTRLVCVFGLERNGLCLQFPLLSLLCLSSSLSFFFGHLPLQTTHYGTSHTAHFQTFCLSMKKSQDLTER